MFNGNFKKLVHEFMIHLLYIFLYSFGPMVIFLFTMFKIEEAACPKKANIEVVKIEDKIEKFDDNASVKVPNSG
ncbi:MAG TPA: hypothetical protein VHZ76_03035 [Gammaproteobacteria bacterium]|jgi:hypothetical protein|nr:hypothetical protein [Gammaproteobacteria bacterium]